MDLENIIRNEMIATASEQGHIILDTLNYSTPVFETGLDSLGFAILVIRLEEKLGFDPFLEIDEAIYPKTFGDFVSMYKSNYEKK